MKYTAMASTVSCGGARFLLCLLLLCSCVAVINGAPLPRKKVAIEGVVYCSDCKHDPNNNFQLVLTRTPIPGAVVKLQCNNTRRSWEEETRTDEKGGFSMKPERVSSWGAHKCRLFLVSSPISNCSSPGYPDPDPDASRWMFGFGLTPVAVNSVGSPFEYYQSAGTLSFFAHWSACLP